MTIQLARDEGFNPDVADYERRFKAFQDKSRGDQKISATALDFGNLPETDDSAKYDCSNRFAKVLAWVQGDRVITSGGLRDGDEAALIFDRTSRDGVVRRRAFDVTLRVFGVHEFAALLRQAHLRPVNIYGGYDLSPLTDDSDSMIVVAEREEA